MSTMVERVAQKMEVRRRELIAQPLNRIWPDLARAAIEAMREPTEAMTKVAADDILAGPGISAFLNWQDLSASRYRLMIDAALSEQEQGR